MSSDSIVLPGAGGDLVTTGKNPTVFFIPQCEENEPLVFKIISDPRFKNGSCRYRPITLHRHNVNESTYTHACLSFFDGPNLEQKHYYELLDQLKELKKQGKDDKSLEYIQVKAKADRFRSKDCAWMLYIKPNDPTIYAMRIGPQVINQLDGKKETTFSKAVPSVLDAMKAKGLNPFQIRDAGNDVGWLSLSKTGTGITTEYTLGLAKTEKTMIQDGATYVSYVASSYPVHSKFTTPGLLTIKDFPDYYDLELKNKWSEEEVLTFIKSDGKVVPDHVLEKALRNSDLSSQSAAPDASLAAAALSSKNAQPIDQLLSMGLPPSVESNKPQLSDIPF